MDWSTTKSEASLPSPVRSRSRSGSPSPPPPRAITINLFPLADSIEFAPKHLSFSPDQEIKVGRVSGSRNQKEAKPDNGVFSCDVMSREHALLKEENGKILIKDLRSTHGTFVNNVRLGDGTAESEWRVLNHSDVITFGHSVRRNQNLYKHLSAYIFYPKETRGDIHSPSTSNGATPIAVPISNPSSIKAEAGSQNALSSPVITEEATSVANTGISQSLMLQSRSEGPASYYIAKSGGLPSAASSVIDNAVPVTKPQADNVTQASEALITETNQASTSKTSEEMLPSIQKLKIDQPDENSHINVESKEPTARSSNSQNDSDIFMENGENNENNENVTDNKVENDHKSESPEITPDTNPVGVTGDTTVIQTSTSTVTKTTISFAAPAPVKDRAPIQVTRETKQSKASRKEKEINTDKDENEQIVVSNGEGPSHVTEDDSSTEIISRKRKYDEIDNENGPEEVIILKEKLAVLEERANKRRKWDLVYSTVIGMAAGAVGIGACAYMFAGI
ncbi:hypothetical protein C1645_732317 [Glomus cerebriforme]|uniref:FHA domain-containing protein n=1 Tax=Glomus cerebriforme TaxID=658196 RepID=A0A397TI51_9GLOM|nr:hypothetical protein C1645_732317 [Glomus cerebriforme]